MISISLMSFLETENKKKKGARQLMPHKKAD
jgi:hypothetical protein